MAIMTKDREKPGGGSPGDNPWEVTDDLLKKARTAGEEIRKMDEESAKNLEKLVLYCPHDGSSSRFIGFRGAYTIVRAFFKCEKEGHEFSWSQGKTRSSDK